MSAASSASPYARSSRGQSHASSATAPSLADDDSPRRFRRPQPLVRGYHRSRTDVDASASAGAAIGTNVASDTSVRRPQRRRGSDPLRLKFEIPAPASSRENWENWTPPPRIFEVRKPVQREVPSTVRRSRSAEVISRPRSSSPSFFYHPNDRGIIVEANPVQRIRDINADIEHLERELARARARRTSGRIESLEREIERLRRQRRRPPRVIELHQRARGHVPDRLPARWSVSESPRERGTRLLAQGKQQQEQIEPEKSTIPDTHSSTAAGQSSPAVFSGTGNSGNQIGQVSQTQDQNRPTSSLGEGHPRSMRLNIGPIFRQRGKEDLILGSDPAASKKASSSPPVGFEKLPAELGEEKTLVDSTAAPDTVPSLAEAAPQDPASLEEIDEDASRPRSSHSSQGYIRPYRDHRRTVSKNRSSLRSSTRSSTRSNNSRSRRGSVGQQKLVASLASLKLPVGVVQPHWGLKQSSALELFQLCLTYLSNITIDEELGIEYELNASITVTLVHLRLARWGYAIGIGHTNKIGPKTRFQGRLQTDEHIQWILSQIVGVLGVAANMKPRTPSKISAPVGYPHPGGRFATPKLEQWLNQLILRYSVHNSELESPSWKVRRSCELDTTMEFITNQLTLLETNMSGRLRELCIEDLTFLTTSAREMDPTLITDLERRHNIFLRRVLSAKSDQLPVGIDPQLLEEVLKIKQPSESISSIDPLDREKMVYYDFSDLEVTNSGDGEKRRSLNKFIGRTSNIIRPRHESTDAEETSIEFNSAASLKESQTAFQEQSPVEAAVSSSNELPGQSILTPPAPPDDSELQQFPPKLRNALYLAPRDSFEFVWPRDKSLQNRAKQTVESITGYAWDWRPFAPPEPLLQSGYRRVKWNAKGWVGSIDLVEEDIMKLDCLLKRLPPHPSDCLCCSVDRTNVPWRRLYYRALKRMGVPLVMTGSFEWAASVSKIYLLLATIAYPFLPKGGDFLSERIPLVLLTHICPILLTITLRLILPSARSSHQKQTGGRVKLTASDTLDGWSFASRSPSPDIPLTQRSSNTNASEGSSAGSRVAPASSFSERVAPKPEKGKLGNTDRESISNWSDNLNITQELLSTPKWMLFGISGTSKYSKLDQIEVVDTSTDQSFFHDLLRIYRKQRGWFALHLSPFTFANCKSVEFLMMNIGRLISIAGRLPDARGRGDEYDYRPRPSEAQLPLVSKEEFRFYLSMCPKQCLRRLWWPWHECTIVLCRPQQRDERMRMSASGSGCGLGCGSGLPVLTRLPKRRNRYNIESEETINTPAFGIETEYDISFMAVATIHMLLLVPSFAFWIYWLNSHPGDIYNAPVPIFIALGITGSGWAFLISTKK